jgi:23S rRNA pseudouridine1911/1915/1917 synthase
VTGAGPRHGTRWQVQASEAGLRLDRFLADATRLGSRSRAAAAIERGQVFLNGRETAAADAAVRLAPADDVRVWRDRPGSARIRTRTTRVGDLEVVYEDAAVVVVNKPPGLLTVPLAGSDTDSVQRMLERSSGRRRALFAVHRIDRDTSGIVVFAKTRNAQARLKDQFARRAPERVYLAVVRGTPAPPAGAWRDRLAWDQDDREQRVAHGRQRGATEAITHYRVAERVGAASVLELRLETGKRNQIRVQAAAHGHPLVGERQYAARSDDPPAFPRQALHAARLSLRHPIDGRVLRFEAALPEDLARLIAALRKR